MNTQRHLPIDLSPLWQYPDNMFVLRYLDMNEAARRKFAWAIKRWAPQRRLRINVIGQPTVEDIQSVLAEINPIILASRDTNTTGDGRLQRSPFCQSRRLDPWTTELLTKIVYRILCTRNKRIDSLDMFSLTSVGTPEAEVVEATLRTQILPAQHANTTENAPPRPEDITMEQLKHALPQNRPHAIDLRNDPFGTAVDTSTRLFSQHFSIDDIQT